MVYNFVRNCQKEDSIMNNLNYVEPADNKVIGTEKRSRVKVDAKYLKTAQYIGTTFGIASLAYAGIGKKLGYLTTEEAAIFGKMGLGSLLISASPTVFDKIQKNDFLEKIGDDLADSSLRLLKSVK